MPSKKSKPTRKAQPRLPQASRASQAPLKSKPSLVWKEEHGCSEQELAKIAESLAKELSVGDRVLLEGEMGAGKTTFSRFLLLALGVEQPPEGSPTFAIAHEYGLAPNERGIGGVVHVDLYRIRSEEEIDERGLPDYYWDSNKLVLSEWTSMWPEFQGQVLRSGQNWKVELKISENPSVERAVEPVDRRDIKITRPERRSSAR